MKLDTSKENNEVDERIDKLENIMRSLVCGMEVFKRKLGMSSEDLDQEILAIKEERARG